MHAIDFRVVAYQTDWGDPGPDEIEVIDIVVDGARLLDLVRGSVVLGRSRGWVATAVSRRPTGS
jgi:hypothetical protein